MRFAWSLILVAGLVAGLYCQTELKNVMQRYKPDPLELDQKWETAIRQVLFDDGDNDNQTESVSIQFGNDSMTMVPSIGDNSYSIVVTTDTIDPIKNINEDEDEDYEDEKKPGPEPKKVTEPPTTETTTNREYEDEDDSAQNNRQQMIRDIALNLFSSNDLARQLNQSRFAGLDEQGQITAIWVAFLDLIETNNAQLMNALTPIGMDIFYQAKNLSPSCSSALRQLIDALREQKAWALRMVDSIGRFPSGLSSGTVSSFGNYDQCLDIKTNVMVSENQDPVHGKYCLLKLKLPVPSIKPGVQPLLADNPINLTGTKYSFDQSPDIYEMVRRAAIGAYSTKFYNAICIPSSCSAQEIQEIVDILFGNNNLSPKLGSCQTKEDQHEFSLNRKKFEDWSNLIVLFCFTLVMLASMVDKYETFFRRTLFENDDSMRIFVDSFSMQKNFQKLISLEQNTVHLVDLSFVNGIRVFLMLWIIMAHVFSVGTLPIPEIIYRFEDELRPFVRSFWMQWIYNGFGSVHAFFFISGFVLSFITIRNRKLFKCPYTVTITTTGATATLDNSAKLQNGETESTIHSDHLSSRKTVQGSKPQLIHIPEFSSYAFERYFQFVIPMIGAFCFNFIWPQLGSGPFFHKVSTKMLRTCENNWWRNLFLINNFDKTNDICMVHTWFLSASFQLHLLAYPVILILARSPKKAIALLVVLVVLGMAIPGWLVYVNKINPTLNALVQVSTKQFYQELALVYYPFYNYLTCYFLGFLLGYLLLVRLYRRFYGQRSDRRNHYELYSMKDNGTKSECNGQAQTQNVTKSNSQSLFQKSFLFTVSLLVTAINLTATFSTYYWTKDDQPKDNVLLNAAYRAFYPVCFIVAQIWLTIACIYYPNNILNRFLSLGFFQVLSRISFSVYMVHLFVVWYFFLQTRQLIRFTFLNLTFFTGGVLLFTIFLALIFELLFISPFKSFMTLQRFRIRRQREQRERDHHQQQKNVIILNKNGHNQ